MSDFSLSFTGSVKNEEVAVGLGEKIDQFAPLSGRLGSYFCFLIDSTRSYRCTQE